MSEKTNGESGFGAFLLGFGVGLGISFLLTPRSGQQNRQLIADKTREGADLAALAVGELKDQVQVRLSDAQEAAQDLKERMGDAAADLRDRVQEAVRAGQEAYRDTLEERKAQLEVPPPPRAATSGS